MDTMTPSDDGPVVRWTPEEVWVMAELAKRLLVATVPVHIEVRASTQAIDLEILLDGDPSTPAVTLSLAACDPLGRRWRDGWALEITRGADDRWMLEPGTPLELAEARAAPLLAHLRVRRRCVVAEPPAETIPLVDAAFHRYTRQSSVATEPDHTPSDPVRWMTPTRAEATPWWEIDLGKPRCLAWIRIDLAAIPPGTRVRCHAFGHHAPSGQPPAGSVVAELSAEALRTAPGQTWFTVDDAVVARHVRVELEAPAGDVVALAVTGAEIQAAELYADTLAGSMRRAFVLHADRPLCLERDGNGFRPALRYDEMWRRAMALAGGLALRLETTASRAVVAVMLRNRPEWIAADLAILERGYLSVALAPDDPDERLAQILALAGPTCVICEAANVARVARLGGDQLRLLVVVDPVEADAPGAVPHVTFEALIAEGLAGGASSPPRDHTEDEPYAVLFTSGSTGTPKGALRTYRTFHAMIASYAIGHSPRHLSFQPLSHLSERMYLPAVLANGGSIAFSQGGAHLLDELAALGPTSVGSVPRLFEVLHAGHERRVRAATADEPGVAPAVIEARVLAETRAQLGERLLGVSVGSAPVSAEVLGFLRRCFADVWVMEGYGTTEHGSIAVDGKILDNVQVKLVPTGATTGGDADRGEIWVRTPHVIAGYLGDATTTVDDDGYVATGDLGERDADGRVRVVGRLRNTIKLAQGEFVSIDRIEAVLATAPVVDRIFVHAGYGATSLAAVVVPRAEFGVRPTASAIAAALRAHARTAGLAAYEVPSEIVVEDEPFSVENGLLTPSGKLARAALVERYAAVLGTPTRPTMHELPNPAAGGEAGDLVARLVRIASQIAGHAVAADASLGGGVGIDSLAAAEILAAISDELDREIPLAWWFEANNLAELAARIAAPDAHLDAAANLARARADLDLPAIEIVRTGAPATSPPRRVLVTGATGFLGAHLVEALQLRGCDVTCLVRARTDDEAGTRLAAALAAREVPVDAARLVAVAGDLGAPALGLAADRRAVLSGSLDAIVHAGATVSWLASYEGLRAPNVLGTRSLLELAAGRGTLFHHVSTISTAPADGDERSTLPFESVVASTPYALSKWIAEEHARRAGAAGLPVAIYRPAMIAGDTRRGVGNADDYLTRYLVACAELGVYVDREDAVIDMTPVDFVAAAIATCVVDGVTGATLHLANVDQSLTYAALGRALTAAGVATRPASYEEFRAALLAHRESRLHPLAAFFPVRFAMAMGPWPCAASMRVLAAHGVTRPRIDGDVIARYVAALRRRGAITA